MPSVGMQTLKSIRDIHVFQTVMPFPLKHNNCFLAESEHGWTVLDTGVNLPVNQELWRQVLHEIGISFKHIQSIYLSHYHHDHIGLAGWLQQQSDAEVFMPYQDLLTFNNYVANGNYYGQIRNTCIKEGWPIKLVKELTADINSIDRLIRPLPEMKPYYEEDFLYLNGEKYEIIAIPGHSDGHYMFFNQSNGILFSGDNIVGHTILHISDWPHTRLLNPLDIHMARLYEIANDSIRFVLPGHGEVFNDLGERIHLIKGHHYKRKQLIYSHLTSPCTAWELAGRTFAQSEYIHIKRLNMAETLAYLSSLINEGKVKWDEHQGRNIYRRIE